MAIFNHWGYPLLIMTSIPLDVAGGIVGLWLLNAIGAQLPLLGMAAIVQPFDMISMLGFLIVMCGILGAALVTLAMLPALTVMEFAGVRGQAAEPDRAGGSGE